MYLFYLIKIIINFITHILIPWNQYILKIVFFKFQNNENYNYLFLFMTVKT